MSALGQDVTPTNGNVTDLHVATSHVWLHRLYATSRTIAFVLL